MRIKILGLVVALILVTAPVSGFAIYDIQVAPTTLYYGDNFTIEIVYAGEGVIQIYDSYDNSLIKTIVLTGEGSFEIPTENLMLPGKYYILVRDEQGGTVWDSRSKTEWGYVTVQTSSPTGVEISINAPSKIAAGDKLEAEIKVYPRNSQFDWLLIGRGISESGSGIDSAVITYTLTEEATYSIRVTSGMEIREKLFEVVKPELSLEAQPYSSPGDLVKINGTTNAADTGSGMDADLLNQVRLEIRREGQVVYQVSGINVVDGKFQYTWKVPSSAKESFTVKAFLKTHSLVEEVRASAVIYNESAVSPTPTPQPTPTLPPPSIPGLEAFTALVALSTAVLIRRFR